MILVEEFMYIINYVIVPRFVRCVLRLCYLFLSVIYYLFYCVWFWFTVAFRVTELAMPDVMIFPLELHHMTPSGFVFSSPGTGKKVLFSLNAAGFFANGLKEAMISTSSFTSLGANPRGVFNFFVDGKLVGTGFRATLHNKTFLFTASHVFKLLDGQRITVVHNKKKVIMEFKDFKVAFCAPSHDVVCLFDNGLIKALGVKDLKMDRWVLGSNVLVRGTQDAFNWFQSPGVSSFMAPMKEGVKSLIYQIQYSASTLNGWSGSPILSASGKVVGIHLGSHAVVQENVGVAITDLLYTFLGMHVTKNESFEEYGTDEWKRQLARFQNRIEFVEERFTDDSAGNFYYPGTWADEVEDQDDDDTYFDSPLYFDESQDFQSGSEGSLKLTSSPISPISVTLPVISPVQVVSVISTNKQSTPAKPASVSVVSPIPQQHQP
uniref:Serine protease n=1 Tax=Riboviria sp. TaxID=2585031 RepID=A0A514D1L3_9VIRU|nr:MAG: hypothetical protein H1Rhizo277897_000002 [Riboviria sp.]